MHVGLRNLEACIIVYDYDCGCGGYNCTTMHELVEVSGQFFIFSFIFVFFCPMPTWGTFCCNLSFVNRIPHASLFILKRKKICHGLGCDVMWWNYSNWWAWAIPGPLLRVGMCRWMIYLVLGLYGAFQNHWFKCQCKCEFIKSFNGWVEPDPNLSIFRGLKYKSSSVYLIWI